MTQTQRDFIESIESRSGRITPIDVIEAARPEDSPIHDCFEWDDGAAATAYRIDQARELIRRVRIEIVHHETTIRCVRYVKDGGLPKGETGYRCLTKLRGKSALETVKAEWAAVMGHAERAMAITDAKADDLPGRGVPWQTAGRAVMAALNTLV